MSPETERLRRDDRQGYRAVSGILSRDRAIRGSFHPGNWLRVSHRRQEKGRLRRDDLSERERQLLSWRI